MKRILKTGLLTLFFLPMSGQTIHLGGNFSYFSSYLFNKSIDFQGDDTVYVLTSGVGAGVSAAFFFDYGGYYYRKIYGIKAEANFSRHNQTYKVFAGPKPANPNIFYKYKTSLSFIDVPLLFNFCPTHHQGITLECGPQISFLRDAGVKVLESKIPDPIYPVINRTDFRNITFSAVLGVGCFYSFTERFALVATFRTGYTFTDLTMRKEGITPYYPTNRFWAGAYIQGVYKINKYISSKNRGYQYYFKTT